MKSLTCVPDSETYLPRIKNADVILKVGWAGLPLYLKCQNADLEISKYFALLGNSKSETVQLYSCGTTKKSIRCHLKNEKKDFILTFRYNNEYGFAGTPTIELQKFTSGENVRTTMIAYSNLGKGLNQQQVKILPANYKTTDIKTGSQYSCLQRFDSCSCYLDDGDCEVQIHITYPKELDEKSFFNNPYINIKKMEEDLLGIRLPKDIDALFKAIESNLLCPYEDFPSVSIYEFKVLKHADSLSPRARVLQDRKILEEQQVQLVKGVIKKLTVLKKGVTFYFDEKTYRWFYEKNGYYYSSAYIDNYPLQKEEMLQEVGDSVKDMEEAMKMIFVLLPEDKK